MIHSFCPSGYRIYLVYEVAVYVAVNLPLAIGHCCIRAQILSGDGS